MRRSFTVLAATILTAATLTAGLALADWPQFMGPKRDGSATDGKLARTWPAEGPKVLWTLKVGPGFGGAAIKGDKAYLLDRVADKQDVLRCIDFATGKEDWTTSYDSPGQVSNNGSRSTPSVDDKYVFTVGAFGVAQAVDIAARKQVWSHDLVKEFANKLPVWAVSQSPLMYKDWVIVAPQSGKVGLVAYEKATGQSVWQSEPVGSWSTSYASPQLFTIAGMEQIVMVSQVAGKKRVNVVGLDPATGKVLWKYAGWECGIPIPGVSDCGEGRFFITGGYEAGSVMFKVEKTAEGFKAAELWKNAECSSHLHTALVHKGYIYANGNSVQNKGVVGLMCLDMDGKAQWKTEKAPAWDLGDVILVDDLLIGMDGAGGTLRLAEADPKAYKQLAEARVLEQKKTVWAPMSFSDGKLIVRDNTTMKCLDLRAAAEK